MFKIPARDRIWEISSPQIMAIMNASSDSFYKPSRVIDMDWVAKFVENCIKDGASLIDIGGQSTRPGAKIISPKEELNNILPLIEYIRAKYPTVLISIDTFNSQVAKEGLSKGAHIINDVSCGNFDAEMLKMVAHYNAGYIGMHLTGKINNMHEIVSRINIIDELHDFFMSKKNTLSNLGINNWVIDPGFGFGKTIEENFMIVKHLNQLISLDLPILLGVSRKSSIYKTLNITADEALNGTTVLNTIGIQNGASIIRVHDVLEAKQIIVLGKHLF
jgi:dihydropteroate synthase